ncbi:MAG: DNA translocase FtsK [Eubacteriales bacterium]|nr:DNA translocase FtsK [Eubacteriales bacterium]
MQMSDISLPKEQAASSGSIFDRLDSSDNAGSIERQTTYAERYGRQIIGEEPARQENRDITPAEDRDIVPTEADYESDEVPFEETEEDIYKSYTYLLKNGIISIDNARRAGFAVGRGNDTSRPSGSSVFDSENREPQHFDAFKVRDDQRNLPGAAEAPGYGDNGYKAPSYEDNGYPGYDAQEPSGYEAQRDEDDYINSGFNAEDIEADDPDSYYDTESASNEENVGGIYSDNYGSDDDTYVTATGKTMETPDRYEAEKIMKKKLGASAVPLRGASGAASGAAASSSAAAASSGSTGKAGQAQSRQAAADPARQAAAKPKPKKKKPYVFPDISLLEKGTRSADNNRGALMANAGKLEKVFRDFGVGVTVTNVTVGPRVSRYELTPDAGVKVSRITSLSGDIKLALAARDIRIEAPIPGKSAVGIEVPNESSTAVKFRDILESEQFKNAKSPLTWGVGLDIGGNTVTCDIAKMPHILVAGTTGSGKSVGINSLIMSILYRCRPEDVRMILVDPKQVEFVVYNGIPHLLTNVVTTPERALSTLNWAVAEMNRRYSLFQQSGTRNIAGYNERVVKAGADLPPEERPEKLPFILIIIDELSELMMHAKKDVESAIVSLAQLARAAGIHLVVATQRPSVDVVTGLIKSNIPSRVAFKLPSITDSRTILDSGGAEALLGNGDMLYKPSDRSSPARVQGAFLKDEEVESVVEFIRKHNPPDTDPEIDTAITKQMELNFSGQQSGGTDKGKNESDLDEFFADAGRLITTSQKASIGGLQRKFKIGFNRAARIMDQLCEAGVVSSGEGTKERQILMDAETFENYLNENGV